MVLSIRYDTVQDEADMEPVTISTLLLPRSYQAISSESLCTFEFVRLAFFALKLRKLEQAYALEPGCIDASGYKFQCNLLQHAIFQQLLSLTRLGVRQQALQLIEASHHAMLLHRCLEM
jgi:hypothetical protein